MSLFETVLNLLRARRPAIEERVELASQAMEVAKQQALLQKFMPAVRERRKLLATPEMNFDLGKARTSQVIDNQGGEVIFVVTCTGTAYFRFDGVEKPMYLLRPGVMVIPFRKLYLTNTAQAGKTLSMIIGQDPSVNFVVDPATEKLELMVAEMQTSILELQKLPKIQTTIPTLFSITMVTTDYEYSQAIPDNTKILRFYELTGETALRYAWITGKVAVPTVPFGYLAAATPWERDGLNLVGATLYLAATGMNTLVGIECWV